jgi:hypothetical protein
VGRQAPVSETVPQSFAVDGVQEQASTTCRISPPAAATLSARSGGTCSRGTRTSMAQGGTWRSNELAGAAFGEDGAFVHDEQAVAQLGGFLHIVGGEDEGDAFGFKGAEFLPDEVAGLGIEAGGWFVEDDQSGAVDEGAGDDEAAFEAAGQFVDAGAGLVFEAHEGEQFAGAFVGLTAAQAEQAAVYLKVGQYVEVGVEVVFLGYDADEAFDIGGVRVRSGRGRLDGLRRRWTAVDHPQGGGFAAPLWPRKRSTRLR